MKILVVDDEQKIADVLAQRLSLRGFDAVSIYDGNSVLSRLKKEFFDGIILDLRLPDIDGIDVLRQVKKDFPNIRIVILSGHANTQDFKTCMELGAIACFHKPSNILKLINAITGTQTREK